MIGWFEKRLFKYRIVRQVLFHIHANSRFDRKGVIKVLVYGITGVCICVIFIIVVSTIVLLL